MPKRSKSVFQLRHCGFFGLRTPLLTMDGFVNWGERSSCTESLESRLDAILQRPHVLEALHMAAPNLYERYVVERLKGGLTSDPKLVAALVRYFARMSTRCTPFGLCAGVSMGRISDASRIELSAPSAYKRMTSLDTEYLASLAENVVQDHGLTQDTVYFANNSWYEIGGQIRYTRLTAGSEGSICSVVTVESTPELIFALQMAERGSRKSLLQERLCKHFRLTECHIADSFIAELIRADLLLSEFALPLTGPRPAESFRQSLSRNPATRELSQALDSIGADLAGPDEHPDRHAPAIHKAVRARLLGLAGKCNASHLICVDLYKPLVRDELAQSTVDEIMESIAACRSLVPTREPGLARFKVDFARRFGDAEVPLLLALDAEHGVSLQTNGIASEISAAEPSLCSARVDHVPWGAFEKLMLRKLQQCADAGLRRIVLEAHDFASLSAIQRAPAPRTVCALFSLLAQDNECGAEHVSEVILWRVAGPHGTNSLSRFCPLDASLEAYVRAHAQAEDNAHEGAVVAEIVHAPHPRLTNVLSRPVLHAYEIPFITRSGADASRQIPLSDLRLSLRADRLTLRSVLLNKRVLPRLTTTHNFANDALAPVYRFLCLLQGEEGVWDTFHWGPAFAPLAFLPRVQFGRLILSLARWRIASSEFDCIIDQPHERLMSAIVALRAKHAMPQFVAIVDEVDEDAGLAIDLENPLSVRSLLAMTAARTQIVLREAPDLNTRASVVRGPDGHYCHQIVLPMFCDTLTRNESKLEPVAEAPPIPAARCAFQPGSEWLYVKIYCGHMTADELLLGPVRQLVEESLAEGLSDRFFFVRYGDPDWHLRVRFHGPPEVLSRDLLPSVEKKLGAHFKSNVIARIQVDTYVRETARYGGEQASEVCERLFCHDSVVTLEMLSRIGADQDLRWQCAFFAMDAILRGFGLDLPTRYQLVCRLEAMKRVQLLCPASSLTRINHRFRQFRSILDTEADGSMAASKAMKRCIAPLQTHQAECWQLAQLLQNIVGSSQTTRLLDIVSSLLHMHANRMFHTAENEQEWALYALLTKQYRSRLARAGMAI